MNLISRKIAKLEESQTMALAARAGKMKADGIDVVSLTAGEPDFPTPRRIKDAAIEAIEANFTRYTAPQGMIELRQAIAAKFRYDNNIHLEPSQVVVSCGAKHSLFNALLAICNKGDEVIIPAPYWVSYPEMAKLVDATPVILHTHAKNQFKMTPGQLRRAITPKTRVLILTSPSNPTGAVYTPEEIADIARVVERTGIFVLSDEIYEKIIYDGYKHFSIGSIEAIKDQVITVNGVSKVFAMTGWRIGYLGAHQEIAAAIEKIQSQTTSNPTSISQKAALAALTLDLDDDVRMMVREFDRRRKYLMAEMKKIRHLSFVYPRGSFTLFISVRPWFGARMNGDKLTTSEQICEFFLNEHNVAMVPGTGFGAKDWVRLSYASSMDDLRKAMRRLHTGFAELQASKRS